MVHRAVAEGRDVVLLVARRAVGVVGRVAAAIAPSDAGRRRRRRPRARRRGPGPPAAAAAARRRDVGRRRRGSRRARRRRRVAPSWCDFFRAMAPRTAASMTAPAIAALRLVVAALGRGRASSVGRRRLFAADDPATARVQPAAGRRRRRPARGERPRAAALREEPTIVFARSANRSTAGPTRWQVLRASAPFIFADASSTAARSSTGRRALADAAQPGARLRRRASSRRRSAASRRAAGRATSGRRRPRRDRCSPGACSPLCGVLELELAPDLQEARGRCRR